MKQCPFAGLIWDKFLKSLSFCLIFALIFGSGESQAAQHKKKTGKPAMQITKLEKNPRYAAIIIDAASGSILHQEDPDELRYPASLTKLMTALMVFEAVDNGRLSMDTPIKISPRAAAQAPSKLGLKPGSSIRVRDAISAISTKSANDIAVALAEAVSGSESAFAARMTQKAKSIGMSRTRFYNASGLPNDAQVTTARDMARLARYILKNYPRDAQVFAQQSFTYQGRVYANHNHLMKTYEGMDCCKTGYINKSGFNLIASAKRGGTRLIGVVMGGKTTASRNMRMAQLLDEGFESPASKRMAHGRQQTPEPAQFSSRNYEITSASPQARAINEAYLKTRQSPGDRSGMTVKSLPKTGNGQAIGTLNLASLSTASGRETAPPRPSLPVASGQRNWTIQIGAYETRLATDQALFNAQKILPSQLNRNQSLVVPLRTADATWVFRARLSGYSQDEAVEACRFFKDCLTIAPQAY